LGPPKIRVVMVNGTGVVNAHPFGTKLITNVVSVITDYGLKGAI